MTSARTARLDAYLDDLAAARIGATFNQYRETGDEDCGPEAPAIRLANLRAYLQDRIAAPVLAVAEAAGYRGARYTGISLFSERQIDERQARYRRSSDPARRPRGFAEASASVVQAVLVAGGWERDVVLWNVVPMHPFGASHDSNRAPLGGEVAAGVAWLVRLHDLLRPTHVVAIGHTAQSALGVAVPAVRHPAHGGATLCTEHLSALLRGWLGRMHPAGGG